MATYLVTGGAGFIGTNLCERLREEGHDVIALDNMCVGDQNVPFLKSIGVKVVVADITDYFAIEPHFANVDVVFHLAAMNRAPRSVEDPVGSHDANITGTVYVLEAMRKHDVPKIVFSSSSSVYAGRAGLLKEDDPLAPPHPYGVGKLASEHYLRVYHELYGVEHVTLRFFSVYGPRQLGHINHAAVIPKFVHFARTGQALPVFGDGTQLRNYTYVKDVVRCCVLASRSDHAVGHIINIAHPEEVTIWDLVDKVRDVTKEELQTKTQPRPPGDPLRNAPDLTKAKRVLQYHPQLSVLDGIKEYTTWYDKEGEQAHGKEFVETVLLADRQL